jgi:hypothetical protein
MKETRDRNVPPQGVMGRPTPATGMGMNRAGKIMKKNDINRKQGRQILGPVAPCRVRCNLKYRNTTKRFIHRSSSSATEI